MITFTQGAAIFGLLLIAVGIVALNVLCYRRRAKLSGAEREKEDKKLTSFLRQW